MSGYHYPYSSMEKKNKKSCFLCRIQYLAREYMFKQIITIKILNIINVFHKINIFSSIIRYWKPIHSVIFFDSSEWQAQISQECDEWALITIFFCHIRCSINCPIYLHCHHSLFSYRRAECHFSHQSHLSWRLWSSSAFSKSHILSCWWSKLNLTGFLAQIQLLQLNNWQISTLLFNMRTHAVLHTLTWHYWPTICLENFS